MSTEASPSPETPLPWTRLAWDSEHLGCSVARIDRPRATPSEVSATLDRLRDAEVDLVYWLAEATSAGEAATLPPPDPRGFLADRRTTFVMRLSDAPRIDVPEERDGLWLRSYSEPELSPDLERLAWVSGERSRFFVDPRIPEKRYRALYSEWMRNSVRRKIAKEVLVLEAETGGICGMITLGEKNGRADIGLVAVSPDRQGRSLGTWLVHSALAWSIEQGFDVAQVVTQGANEGACRLYRKTGYSLESVEPFWHFWL